VAKRQRLIDVLLEITLMASFQMVLRHFLGIKINFQNADSQVCSYCSVATGLPILDPVPTSVLFTQTKHIN
jgi:hypothetical protein